MDEKGMMRGIYFALAFIATILFVSFVKGAEKEDLPGEAAEDVRIYSEEEFRTEIVDLNLEDFIDDEVWGEYAKSKLAEQGFYVITGITGTVYNAVENQCDSSPLVTADGSRIDSSKVLSGETKWIAVSRDLLRKFNYGDRVKVSGAGKMDGVWEIHDTMNSRFNNYIDFLVPDHVTTGQWKSITITSVKD